MMQKAIQLGKAYLEPCMDHSGSQAVLHNWATMNQTRLAKDLKVFG